MHKRQLNKLDLQVKIDCTTNTWELDKWDIKLKIDSAKSATKIQA